LKEFLVTTDWLTPKEAAAYLRLSFYTLEQWRMRRKGPRYRKVGRSIRYHRADLEAWMRAFPVQRGTHDDPNQREDLLLTQGESAALDRVWDGMPRDSQSTPARAPLPRNRLPRHLRDADN
jgi:excisionase family DNA binding protein